MKCAHCLIVCVACLHAPCVYAQVRVNMTLHNVTATAAHIHAGALWASGGVLYPLATGGNNSTLISINNANLALIKQGKTYVNVHSEANAGGKNAAVIEVKCCCMPRCIPSVQYCAPHARALCFCILPCVACSVDGGVYCAVCCFQALCVGR